MNQSEKRLFLIQSLLKEKTEYRNIDIPAEPESQRQFLRGLMNIRAPRRIGAEFLKLQDEYLQNETGAEKPAPFSVQYPYASSCIKGIFTNTGRLSTGGNDTKGNNGARFSPSCAGADLSLAG